MTTQNDETTGRDGEATKGADRRVFDTAEAAKAAGAVLASQVLYAVTTGDGATAYCWARNASQAFMTVALGKGWKAAPAGTDPRGKAAAALAQLSPEDRAALLAQFSGGAGAGTADLAPPAGAGAASGTGPTSPAKGKKGGK
jgi:hypothetical protein